MSGNDEGTPLADALVKLQEAMRGPSGGSTDPDRRRAASRLADLIRSEDDELERFAKRHLSGRPVDAAILKETRELALGIARLTALQGRSNEVAAVTAAVRSVLLPRLDELESSAAAPPSAVAAPSPLPFSPPPFPSEPAAIPVRPPSVPFQKRNAPPALPPHLAALDLEAYAGFTGLLTVYPEHHAQAYAQYGVRDHAERELLDRHWRGRIDEEPALRSQWTELRERAIAHYRSNR